MALTTSYDFGAGRAGQIAKHAGDAARAVARGAAGDRPAGDVAAGVANAVAAAPKVVADIADDAARTARALSDEHGRHGVLARIASDADEAKAAAESVADAAREAVYEAARAVPAASPAGGGRDGAAASIDLFGIDVGSPVVVSEYVRDATRTVSGDMVEASCSTAAFASRITSDAVLAVASTAEAAGCAARAVSGSDETALEGPRSAAAAAAAAIADEVDPDTARALEIDPTRSEVLANLEEGPISVALRTLRRPWQMPQGRPPVPAALSTSPYAMPGPLPPALSWTAGRPLSSTAS